MPVTSAFVLHRLDLDSGCKCTTASPSEWVAVCRNVLTSMFRIVSSRPGQTLLPAVQEVLRRADEALLAVAFVDTRGIHLLEKEMKTVGSVRMLATTQFDRDHARTDTALARVTGFGATARLLNPKRGTTFHPKMYLARRGHSYRGVIGSCNLTFGLAGNYETGVLVDGSPGRDAWALGEELWDHAEAVPWVPRGPVRPDELDGPLYRLLSRYVHAGLTFPTLGPRPELQTVLALSPIGATVATKKSPGGQQVEARMIQLGYDALVTSPNGQLTNPHLLKTLRVHRSSFVLALLAQLPMVRQVSASPITIELVGPPPTLPSSVAP
jgi:HKD family nuclease